MEHGSRSGRAVLYHRALDAIVEGDGNGPKNECLQGLALLAVQRFQLEAQHNMEPLCIRSVAEELVNGDLPARLRVRIEVETSAPSTVLEPIYRSTRAAIVASLRDGADCEFEFRRLPPLDTDM